MRYISRPKLSGWDDQGPFLPQLTVYESEKRPVPTGLVDRHGHAIYRLPDEIKMGFE